MNYHSQNLSDGKLPKWRYGRAWWGPFAWCWNVFYPTTLLSFSVRRWGFSLWLRSFGFSFGMRRDEDSGRGRWEVSWHGGCLWMEHPWVRQDEWRRSDRWWRKQCVLHVVDWLIGKMRYTATEEKPVQVFVPMPEGCYRATAKLRHAVRRRRWYWPVDYQHTYDIDVPGGIPFAGKGENSYDCGDDGLFGISGDFPTIEKAIAAVVESVLRSRRRHGHDAGGTGKEPAVVVNEAAT